MKLSTKSYTQCKTRVCAINSNNLSRTQTFPSRLLCSRCRSSRKLHYTAIPTPQSARACNILFYGSGRSAPFHDANDGSCTEVKDNLLYNTVEITQYELTATFVFVGLPPLIGFPLLCRWNDAAAVCSKEACLGSVVYQHIAKTTFTARPKDEVILHAKNFLDQYFASIKSEEAEKARRTVKNGLAASVLAKIADMVGNVLSSPNLSGHESSVLLSNYRCMIGLYRLD
ncbi:hypothetical protein J6590_026836 [Homalodisca vitripennis]|nr:hypothetical protein J6590_026836 [Homalodisca vitripennis]